MEQNRVNEFIAALTARGVNQPCPRCGNGKFSVIGETTIPLQQNPTMLVIGGPSIPTVIVACDNCGFLTQHATMPLGLSGGAK